MASSPPSRAPVRLSKIAGRYLVFDLDDVMYLRREHNICAVFTGTIPLAPSQNIFLGLPIELYAEEAKLLVERKAAFVEDDAVAQLLQLKAMDEAKRKAYLHLLKTQRKNASLVFEKDSKERLVQSIEFQKRKGKRSSQQTTGSNQASESTQYAETTPAVATAVDDEESLFDVPPTPKKAAKPAVKNMVQSITPSTSAGFLNSVTNLVEIAVPKSYPLYAHLHSEGYFITPGLRFGVDYSVYPGDPFRYHAHFMANGFGWDEELPILDIIALGRLGTRVKKSYLLGGAPSPGDGDEMADGADSKPHSGDQVRTFCLEWAGM